MSQEKYRFQVLGARLQAEQSGINLIIVAWVEFYRTQRIKHEGGAFTLGVGAL